MQTPQSLDKLGRVKTGSSLAELLVFAQVKEELSTVEEIHNEVKFGRCLKGIVQLHNKWTVDFFEDVSFRYNFIPQ